MALTPTDKMSHSTVTFSQKKIVKEYPMTRVKSTVPIQFYRFPVPLKGLKITSVKLKPISKFVEISLMLPHKNVSALKAKALNTDSFAFRAFPVATHNLSYVSIDGDTATVHEIQNVYLFQPFHFYYPFDYTFTRHKKAESREEFERRLQSINYRLKSVDLEEFTLLPVEAGQLSPVTKVSASAAVKKDNPVNFKKIEEIVRRARIVNLAPLVDIFHNENAVRSVLYRMTDQLCGRFVLKNKFYEGLLHGIRSQMLGLFRSNMTVRASDLDFLGDEIGLAAEISDMCDGAYVLRGFRENIEFDDTTARMANMQSIRMLLRETPLLSASQIASKLSIDEDVISELISGNVEFFHLSNNTFAVNDPDQPLSWVFSMLVDRKSFVLSELLEKLQSNNIEMDETVLVDEIKKYCTLRSERFYLRTAKE